MSIPQKLFNGSDNICTELYDYACSLASDMIEEEGKIDYACLVSECNVNLDLVTPLTDWHQAQLEAAHIKADNMVAHEIDWEKVKTIKQICAILKAAGWVLWEDPENRQAKFDPVRGLLVERKDEVDAKP